VTDQKIEDLPKIKPKSSKQKMKPQPEGGQIDLTTSVAAGKKPDSDRPNEAAGKKPDSDRPNEAAGKKPDDRGDGSNGVHVTAEAPDRRSAEIRDDEDDDDDDDDKEWGRGRSRHCEYGRQGRDGGLERGGGGGGGEGGGDVGFGRSGSGGLSRASKARSMSVVHTLDRGEDAGGGGGGGGGMMATPTPFLPPPSRALAGGQRNGASPQSNLPPSQVQRNGASPQSKLSPSQVQRNGASPQSNHAGTAPSQAAPSSLFGGGLAAQAAANGRFAIDEANGRFVGTSGVANGRLSADWVKTLGVPQPAADAPVGDAPVGDAPVGGGVKRWSRQQRDGAQGDRECSSRGCRKVNPRP
jgi:hypothetical protein